MKFYQGDFRFVDDENSDAERLRITSAGNLGIGDASPTKPLTVGTTTPVILLDDQSSRTLEIRGPSATHVASILRTSGHDLLLGTNNAERLRITSGGDISIGGLASPRAKLDIEDAGTSKDVILRVSADDNNPYALVVANDTFNTTSNRGFAFWVGSDKVHHIEARTSTTNSENEIMVSAGDAITFRTNVSEERLRIDSSGNLTAVNTSSGGATTLKVGANATSGVNNGTIIINNGGTGDAVLQFDYEGSAARAKIMFIGQNKN